MLSCGPDAWRAASGASPLKFGVNVGPGGLPPTSVQIGTVVHWLLTSPIRESVTADRSNVMASPDQLCAVPYQRRSPSASRPAPVSPAGERGRPRAAWTGDGNSCGAGVGAGTTV